MTYSTSKLHLVLLLLLVGGLVMSCEDPLPDDYIPELVVQGFAIADRPLSKILVYESQPITDTFRLKDAVIRDAEVVVLENGTPVAVHFVESANGGYYEAVDTSYRVKHDTKYEIRVRTDKYNASATATTKPLFNWIIAPKSVFQYPGEANETDRIDSLDVSWETVPGVSIYVVGVECLDTLNYGLYLDPPTAEANRRIRDSEFDEDLLINTENTRYGAVFFQPNSSVVWSVFRWFGMHKLHIYAGDSNFQKWFQQAGFGGRSSYDYRLGNIQGGLGIWAGASEVDSDIFLLKDVP